MKSRWTKRRWLLIVIVLSLGIVAWAVQIVWFPGQPFDPDLWRTEEPPSMVRQRMADRLLARRTLIGLSRTKVVTMLGEPPGTDYFRDWDMVYLLGYQRSFISIDSEWLVLRLGSDGIVIDAQMVTD